MYLPSYHREDRLEAQHDLIRAYPLASLVTMGRDGLIANPVPFILDATASPKGVLKAHIARANPLWQDYDPSHEALVIFHGPQSYVSPSFYASKKETGKVVPTWNYVCVQAYGRLKVIEEQNWLVDQIRALTKLHEANQPTPWTIEDAPADFVASMLNAIIGIEIDISRIEGKWKLSQNRSAADRASLIQALRISDAENAATMASLIHKGDMKS
ncbi:MAG: FMN-binding negative transcriptional regulator [Methylovirgula sp.]